MKPPALPALSHELIRASAGSGKTYHLAVRYLALLVRGAEPSSILATTFTRKAAGEILQRVLARLAAAAGENADPQRARLAADLGMKVLPRALVLELLQVVSRSMDRLAIVTIDSFLHRLAGGFRLELGLAASLALVAEDDPQALALRRRAIEAVLADDDLFQMLDLLRRLHQDSPGRSVTNTLDSIFLQLYPLYRQAPDRAVWTKLPASGGGPTDPKILAELAGQLLAAGEIAQHAAAAKQADSRLVKAILDDHQRLHARQWDAFLENGLVPKILKGETTYYNKPWPPEVDKVYQALGAQVRGYFLYHLARRTEAFHELLARFDKHYSALRRREGVLLFSDLPHLLGQELPQHPDLLDTIYYRLDGQLHHLLLDEFQDTSLEQWRVLQPMAQEISAHADGSRTLLCVGDVKQSIYGWRGGCPEIFDLLAQRLHLPDEAVMRWNHSYRSSPVVLDAVNTVFAGLPRLPSLAEYPAAGAWAVDFAPHQSKTPRRPGFVQLLTSPRDPQGDDAADNDDDAHAPDSDGPPSAIPAHDRFVGDFLGDLARRMPGLSIGVLLRRNKKIPLLLHLLRQQGLEASGEGGGLLTDDPGVNLILSALTLADHPGDSAAVFHVRHSPLADELELANTTPQAAESAARKIRRQLLAEGYSALLARWAKILAPHAGPRGLIRLHQLLELAERSRQTSALRPGAFVQAVQNSTVEEPSPAAIRVMTIHRAKGLEFDIVVLPELDQPLLGRPPLAYTVRQDPTGPVEAVYASIIKKALALDPALQHAHQQHEFRQLREELCGLYVAMTRPRHALYMIVPARKQNKSGLGKRRFSYATLLIEAFGIQNEAADVPQILHAQGDAGWHQTVAATMQASGPELASVPLALTDLQVHWPSESAGPRRSWARVSPSSLEQEGLVQAGDLLAPVPHEGAQRGLVMHAWLRRIAWLPPEVPPEVAPEVKSAQPPALPGGTSRLGATQHAEGCCVQSPENAPGNIDDRTLLAIARREAPQQTEAWHQELRAEFRRLLGNPALADALRGPPRDDGWDVELWRERSFAVRHGQRLLCGTFDRVVIRRQAGQVRSVDLLDFKTDFVQPGGANMPQLLARYQPQMEAYRQALSAMLGVEGKTIRARLLFVRAGECREV
ncbi:MAG: UvrD-helicase domain-containing protein [Phycisphaeraceae bacterium]|nr:UvrD-helicase domain-containing protein [Phycisphaeraceae bacterium]